MIHVPVISPRKVSWGGGGGGGGGGRSAYVYRNLAVNHNKMSSALAVY